MGLVVVPGGFGTPEFEGRRLLVIDGMLSDGHRREPITNLLDACAFAGVDATVTAHPALALPADPETPLAVDTDAARVLGRWFAFCQSLLEATRTEAGPEDEPSAIQLWPEHFDLAFEMGTTAVRATYGGSPGDDGISTPYLYVGPHETHHGPFWNAPFGASLTYDDVKRGVDPVAFFSQGRELLGRA
jgi:hypothetical protein